MAIPTYLAAPTPEDQYQAPSFLDRVGTGISKWWDQTPPEAFFALSRAMLTPGAPFASKLGMGISGLGEAVAANKKKQGLASAFDQFLPTVPEQYRPIVQQMVQNDPRALAGAVSAQMFAKPPEEPSAIREYKFSQSQGYKGTFDDWVKDQKRAGASNTTVNVGGSEKQIFDALQTRYDKVAPIVGGMNSLREARDLVEKGGIFGAAADWRVGASKFMSLLTGKPVDPAVVNTETFKGAIQPLVAATLRATSGTSQLSEGELKFAQNAAAGNIDLDQASIKRILDIMEKAMRNTAKDYNRQLDFVYPKGTSDRSRALFEINIDPPSQTTTASGKSKNEFNYNPATGRAE